MRRPGTYDTRLHDSAEDFLATKCTLGRINADGIALAPTDI